MLSSILSAIDWSAVSTETVIEVIGAIFSVILIPLIVNFFKKHNEKHKEVKETKKDAKKEAQDFLIRQSNQIDTISDGFSIRSTTLDTTWDFGISRQLTSKEIEENNKALEQNRQAPNSIIKYSTDEFITKLLEEKRALVIGDAGQGKSIFMKNICNKLVSQKNNKKLFFPIYVEIKTVISRLPKNADRQTKGDIIEAVFSAINIGCGFFDYISKNYEICYIFDAIDEVSPNDFRDFKSLVANRLSDAYLVFSSRPGQIDICNSNELSLSNMIVRKWTLNDISDDKLKSFLQNDKLYNAILGAESKDPNYKKLSRNPLLLSLIKNVYNSNNTLPNSRVQLFDRVIKELIEREISKEENFTYTNNAISSIKEVLGKVSYEIYKKKDGSTIIWSGIDSLLRDIINNRQDVDTLTHFFDEHTLIDENGFSHELFASYYCAYYLYKHLCENKRIDKIVKEINRQSDYWKDVVITLLCLFEQNAQDQFDDTVEQSELVKERLDILLTMLKTMQGIDKNYLMVENPLVDTPDYDILCEAVSQFIDIGTNKPLAEEVLIRGMLIRGEKGILSYDINTHDIKDSRGVNPYEELFYYTVLYDFKGGLNLIYKHQKDLSLDHIEALSSIQRCLFNKLCEVEHCDELTLQFIRADSLLNNVLLEINFFERTRGHFHFLDDWRDYYSLEFTSLEVSGKRFLKYVACNNYQNALRISVDKNNKEFCAIDDCLIEKETNTLVLGCKNSKIPNWVTNIGRHAFFRCTGLQCIEIPGGVTSIGDYAFGECTGLQSIDIPNSAVSIGKFSFYRCTGLSNITIQDGVTTIGDYAFYGCTGLTSVDIPDSVTSIGYNPFECCGALEKITVGRSNKKYHSQDNCLIETETKSLIFGCKNSIITDGVTNIGSQAFVGCTGLTSITIPNSVTRIDGNPFNSCNALEKITVGRKNKKYHSRDNCLIEIETNRLISGCKNSRIPKGVTIINHSAFGGCTDITSITIPDSVKGIGIYSFSRCECLTNVKFKDINGWYVVEFDKDVQSAIPIDVSDPEKNAIYLKSTYNFYDWVKVE